jgi:anti-sigma B factor antagonist
VSVSANYYAARGADAVYVRSTGLANMKNAPLLDAFLAGELEAGARKAYIDLAGCTGMDSTFMGLMVGYAKQFEDVGGKLAIVNPGPNNLRLLKMLGVTEVVSVSEGQRLPPDIDFVQIASDPDLTPGQRAEMIARAHQNLMRISEANKAKFSAFVSALEQDLSKLRGR